MKLDKLLLLLEQVETVPYKPGPTHYDLIREALGFDVHYFTSLIVKAWLHDDLNAVRELHDVLIPEWFVACFNQMPWKGYPWRCSLAHKDGGFVNTTARNFGAGGQPARTYLCAMLMCLIDVERTKL